MSFTNDFNEFDFESRILSTEETRADIEPDVSLRPQTLADYVGQ